MTKKNFEDKIPTELASISNCWRLELWALVESFWNLIYLMHVILFFLHSMKFSVGESRSCALFTNNNKWKAAAFVATTTLPQCRLLFPFNLKWSNGLPIGTQCWIRYFVRLEKLPFRSSMPWWCNYSLGFWYESKFDMNNPVTQNVVDKTPAFWLWEL